MRLESDFVRESVRKNVSYTADAEGNVRLRKNGSKFDDFGISLVRKLRAYNDELPTPRVGATVKCATPVCRMLPSWKCRARDGYSLADKASNVRMI